MKWATEAAMCRIHMRSKYDGAEDIIFKMYVKFFGMRTSGTSWRKSGKLVEIRSFDPSFGNLGVPDVRITNLKFWVLKDVN